MIFQLSKTLAKVAYTLIKLVRALGGTENTGAVILITAPLITGTEEAKNGKDAIWIGTQYQRY